MQTLLPKVTPAHREVSDGYFPGEWWHRDGDRVVCTLCPRKCALKDGDRGFCFVRQNLNGEMWLTTYGRSTGFCIDPIEKKPLNHFYPGTSVLSFGTAGCNLGCKFCQNWDISKAREVERLSHRAMPDEIALAAKSLGCHSVAYTYNDPVIWAEYAIDTAKACRAAGVKNVAVTAGYITEEARGPFYEFMDAANVDLKAFTEDFYYKITYSHLQPILDTLKWLKHETPVWFEITNLVIPNANDRPDEIKQMSEWVLDAVGDEVPIHFTAFHPDFRMLDRPATPHDTLIRSREIAMQVGLKHVFVGNVNDVARQSTFCPNCKKLLIERNWYELGTYALQGNRCRYCLTEIAGQFLDRPGNWGRKRQPVDMRQFHIAPVPTINTTESTILTQLQTTNNSEPAQPRITTQHSSGGPTLMSSSNKDGSTSSTKTGLDESALQWLASQQPAVAPVKIAPLSPAPQNSTNSATNAPPAPVRPIATQPPTRLPLTSEQREAILAAAAECVKAAVENRPAQIPDLKRLGVADAAISGAFVSLKRDKRLRSCCGSFGQTMPLQRTIEEASLRTATDDPRFPPIAGIEIPHLDLEVWLLFSPERVHATGLDRINEVTIGMHGLQIVRGNQRGLLLPGVATDNDWDSETFLNQVCIKAGLPPTAWKESDTVLFRFEGNVIYGRMTRSAEEVAHFEAAQPLYSPEQFEEFRRICKDNIAALIRGATPMYYCGTVPDSSVNGIALNVTLPGGGQEVVQARMALRDLMPLQTTAFAMCEELANQLRRRGFLNANFNVDLSIAFNTTMHGSIDQPSLSGINPRHRAILVSERNRTAWVYDRDASVEKNLDDAAELCQVAEPIYAQIFSLEFQSTRVRTTFSAVPRPQRGSAERPAAVAGRFYPGDAPSMNQMLDKLLDGEATPLPCSGAMIPHAGWAFSGKLAADVLKRVQLPKRVIIIGPKHTHHGSEWAVAPHHVWQLPGCNVASDFELAAKLSERIKGLQLDSAAHQAEHGIEVNLPMIARLNPETKVVGIAVGAANLERCDAFATELAEVIRELDEPPLLIISSDMNHYATDEENRRLDAMALADFDRLDEDSLFRTCRANQISMCGVVPAVIVIKTLKKLGRLRESMLVGYATSADANGDTTRVVGYAGRLLR